ncbi:hypothetical protein GCM10017607_02280 [Microbacterium thalassium]|nr:hypothetical protein GCM10017607_02280 [Microbacterium thalassium]
MLTHQQLRAEGRTARQIGAAVAGGRLRRLQRNRYVDGALWADLWPESRHRLEVSAAFAEMDRAVAVAVRDSAAAVWALPLYRHVPDAVHVALPPGARAPSRPGLARHAEELSDDDIAVIGGVRCTSLERTVFDLARTLSFAAAVSAADAALRRVAMTDRRYDTERAEAMRARLAERAAGAKGARGIRQAREVIAFADGRAELPGESVTRVRLHELGFRCFELQVPVPGPAGHDYEVDIGIAEARALLEFDGEGKYRDAALRHGKTIEDVILAEKRREDWIRGTRQERFGRVEDPHIADAATLARRLAAFGITPPIASSSRRPA